MGIILQDNHIKIMLLFVGLFLLIWKFNVIEYNVPKSLYGSNYCLILHIFFVFLILNDILAI